MHGSLANMRNDKIKIGIIGIGMVGEPIRRWFEEVKGYKRGQELFLYDIDLKKGYNDDFNKADLIFIALPTPSKKDGQCDTALVEKAVTKIADNHIVVIKSTVPPGTAVRLAKRFPKKEIIFNPEFLTESQVWSDFLRPDRQLVGAVGENRTSVRELLMILPMASFTRPWGSDYSKKEINATEAELSKYASNVFGYIKVIYGNILADVAHAISLIHKADISYERVRDVIAADPRIGPAWLNVDHGDYCGAGGYCFPKDMNAFIAFIKNDLIKRLRKNKSRIAIVEALEKGVAVLESIRDYNRAILKLQGLSESDISLHNAELVNIKRKSFREKWTRAGSNR